MAETTAIEWADATWSPVWGCTQVSPACDNCYAKALAHRWGYGWNGEPMRLFGDEHWRLPLRWNRKAAVNRERWRVFPSMCDPLDKDIPVDTLVRFLDLIRQTPQLDWLLLSKRIGNWRARLEAAAASLRDIEGALQEHERDTLSWIERWLGGEAPANVWPGATVINQPEADRDITKLLAVPARVRFLSIEPMLGAVDLHDHLMRQVNGFAERLHWVIAGGESGPHARPAHPDWFRSLRDQCASAGVAFTLKQHGEWIECETEASTARPGRAIYVDDGYRIELEDGRRYDTLMAHDTEFVRVGKKGAGRLLDGVTHDGVPAP